MVQMLYTASHRVGVKKGSMPVSAATSNTKQLTAATKEVTDRFDESWNYAKDNHHRRFERNYKLYNNKRAIVSYKGITNTFVPMVFSTVETLTAALCAGRPSIDFVPQDMYKYIMTTYSNGGKQPDLKALNALFDYYWDCDNWDLKSIKTVRAGFIYGLATEWLYWDGDKPRIININPRDAIIDPSLVDPMDLITDPDHHYGGRRYFTTLEALKSEQIADPETGKMKPRFKNLQKVRPGFTGSEENDKQFKEMQIGSIGNTEKQIEVIEIWDGKRIRSVAQRCETIEDRENVLGIIPQVLHRFIADESLIYGKAIVDPIAHPQELLNDITNQRVDAVTDVLLPQAELDPTYASWIPKLKNAPGVVYPFKSGTLTYIQKPPVPTAAFQEGVNQMNVIREAVAVDQVTKGVTADQSQTATEVKAQLGQAGQRFELYIRMLEKEGFYQRSKIVYKMILHYVKDMTLVPTSTSDGPKFRTFNPKQFDDTYEPKIQLEANVQNQKFRNQQVAERAFTAIIADKSNDLWEAKKVLYPKMFDLSEEELDKIIGAQKPAPEGMMGGGQGSEIATEETAVQPEEPNPFKAILEGAPA